MPCRLHRRRAAAEDGFTLIELLVVLVIIAVLLAIAVPSYLGFKDRAADRAAQANLRASLPAAEAYYSDTNTYVGMTRGTLLVIDAGLSPTLLSSPRTPPTTASPTRSARRLGACAGPGTPAPSYVANGTCS